MAECIEFAERCDSPAGSASKLADEPRFRKAQSRALASCFQFGLEAFASWQVSGARSPTAARNFSGADLSDVVIA